MNILFRTKIALITGALAVAVFPLVSLGENDATSTNVKRQIKQERQQVRTDIQKKQQALQQEAKQKREALMQEIRARRETFKAEAQKRIDALKKKVGEERAKRIDQFFNQMVRKFENAIDRLNNLADRIESRLNKTEAAGNDVSKQRDMLKVARDKIAAAGSALSDAKAQFGAMTKSENPKEAFQKVKELVKGVAQIATIVALFPAFAAVIKLLIGGGMPSVQQIIGLALVPIVVYLVNK